jgi:hypothetical protein
MSQAAEEFIETVDIRQLHERYSQILRLFVGSFLDRLAFGCSQGRLLVTGRWERLRAEPRRDGRSGVSRSLSTSMGLRSSPVLGPPRVHRAGAPRPILSRNRNERHRRLRDPDRAARQPSKRPTSTT